MKVKIITKLEEHISEELDKINNDETISKEDKIEAFNVYYNTYQFLKNYDKNIQRIVKDIRRSDNER
jgi:hypothetical protein